MKFDLGPLFNHLARFVIMRASSDGGAGREKDDW
jgi:hypothetical protein